MRADIAIIGAGPAGLAAATAVLGSGRQVTLIDDNPAIGGQIWRGMSPIASYSDMLQHPALTYLPSTRVVAAPSKGRLLLETATGAINLTYARLIVTTGAREQLLPFPGWTLPGVMGLGGLQAMVKSGLNVRGQRIVLGGTGPLLLAVADTCRRAGADVILIAEQAQGIAMARFAISLRAFPAKLAQASRLLWSLRSTPYRPDSYVTAAFGHDRLQGVRLRSGSQLVEFDCDWLGVGYGLRPNTELLQTLGCVIDGDHALVDDHLRTSVTHIYAAGESTGVGGVDKALLEGRLAGLAAAGCMFEVPPLVRQRQRHLHFVQSLTHHFQLRPEIAAQATENTIVCRCEDVTHGRLAGFENWREAKLQTRCGMGPCQGRICASACATLFGWSDANSRPPLQPARLSTLATLATSTGATFSTVPP